MQYAGMPLVHQSPQTFPDNFIVESPTLEFHMNVDMRAVFTLLRPAPGNWYIIAFKEGYSTAIQLKGLSSEKDCLYSLMTQLELGDSIESTLISYNTNVSAEIGLTAKVFSFKVPSKTYGYTVNITSCQSPACNISMTYLPALRDPITQHCDTLPCVLSVSSPSFDHLQMIEMHSLGPGVSQTIEFSVVIKECSSVTDTLQKKCVTFPLLDRVQPLHQFNTYFGYVTPNSVGLSVDLRAAPVVTIPFKMIDPADIGGTLKWTGKLVNYTHGLTEYVVLCGAIIYNHLPDVDNNFDVCNNLSETTNRTVTAVNYGKITQYVPYPKAGMWHIVLQAKCYKQGLDTLTVCPQSIDLDIDIETQACFENGCSDKGECYSSKLGSDFVFFSACDCLADYQGYACTDDSNAESSGIQLVAAFLLTLSNLFFLPAIIIGIKRRFLVESFVFTYTMFFSTFYHACDGNRLDRYRLCFVKYDVLQACDFFGSSCSVWFTLVAMAQIRLLWITRVLQIIGPFGILIGIIYDRTSICVIAVPLLSGLLVTSVSWGVKMYQRKRLYPTWRRYVFFLLPGVILAVTGGALFAFLETAGNYKYLHSLWHVCVASCICFLLPPNQPSHDACSMDVESEELSI
ncbi:unnamed protein product [Lymnaea stagnalis]|uniref:EGF-like domain-containing protein n=1 Tax=Lymnaea stagnalis TaxID=6523 RepID=A0AAV2IKV5_LYMST